MGQIRPCRHRSRQRHRALQEHNLLTSATPAETRVKLCVMSALPTSNSKSVQPSAEMTEVLVDGARYGDMDDVQSALQSSVDVNATDDMGRTALHMAAANDHADVAATLLEAGADVDIRNAEGNTPLHWACLNGCHAVAKLLLGGGANPATLNSHSNTPVDELLGKPYQTVMLELIESYTRKDKTDHNMEDPDGNDFADEATDDPQTEEINGSQQ